jgi:short subunit dehydrogenase-like uncharacterized protein
MSFLLYGANGYTGALIAREAVARGLSPILAGRSHEKLAPLAEELKIKARAFKLEDVSALNDSLADVSLVLHCAGPFSATCAPMLQACLKAKVHYLDISGEISCFEYAHARHLEAQTRGVVVCPGVGFDVVPTDCLAATLKAALPDAEKLALGFASRSGFSPGTAKTMIENLPLGGCVRRGGKLSEVPHFHHTRKVDFGNGDGEKLAGTIPWGDVATAFYTTGIPDIEVFVPVSRSAAYLSVLSALIRFATAPGFIQRLLKRQAERRVRGPSARVRDEASTYVWGEAKNTRGEVKTARVRTANGYALTVTAALAIVEHLLANKVAPGFYTPSRLMGADFVSTLPGSSVIELS